MSMQITNLRVEDFKRIRFVDVKVDGNVITIGGDNAQGKSSLLDAIWNALGGKQKAVERPIRDGEKRAQIEVTIEDGDGGGYLVTRKYSGAASTLTVSPLDNPSAKLASPQKVLDDLVGRFAFDPLEFAMQDKKKQLATLIEHAELDFDPIGLEASRRELYEERTMVGRDVKRTKGALDSLGRRPEVTGEPRSIAALADELRETEATERDLQSARTRHGLVVEEIRELEKRLEQARANLESISAEGRRLALAAASMRSAEDIRAEMEGAEETNHAFAERDRWDAVAEEYRESQKAYDLLSEKIKNLDKIKSDGLARAQLPIEGLSFDSEGVLYQGVPFSQASAAERIKVSVAMAMAMNPTLRVICVKDATLLDEKNRALLIRLASENGFQVFLEMVGASDQWSFVLEDGEVA